MSTAAKNLRIFFGPSSVKVWSLWRDNQRAENSVEIYRQVLQGLQKDLDKESQRRGSLVNERSLLVTEARQNLEAKEAERLILKNEISRQKELLSSFVSRLQIHLKALFLQKSGVETLREKLREDEEGFRKIQQEKEKLKDDLAETIFRQKAAIDPIEDLRFAIDYLNEEIQKCRQRTEENFAIICDYAIRRCLYGSALQLQLMFANGLKVKDSQEMSELYFAISNLAHKNSERYRQNESYRRINFREEVKGALYSGNSKYSARLDMRGRGTHHRKVKKGDNHVWCTYDVSLLGSISKDFSVERQKLNSDVIAGSLSTQAVADFLGSRGEQLSLREELTRKRQGDLLQLAGRVWEQLVGFVVK